MDKRNVIMNSVRMRIVQYLMINGTATATQLAKDMTEVPKTTLYRHINVLEQAGVISVVDERKVRGTIEKTFAINMETLETEKDEEIVLNNAFSFLMNVYGDFVKYFTKEEADPQAEGVFIRTSDFMLKDKDFDKFCKELEGVFEKYKAKSGDKLRKITIISSPGGEE
ncbi:MAG: helix-turn-helix domain-containing protein [Lachnospiraceae bacterium]|nr:helix-turn-helix domain-containing protein [Lachnospiraceae bacterium]